MQRSAAPVMSQADVENVKKCKNFFSTLLRLAAAQPAETLATIKRLIQSLLVCSVAVVSLHLSLVLYRSLMGDTGHACYCCS